MSLDLRNLSSSTNRVNVKTFGAPISNTVNFGTYEVPMEDFMEAVWYVLTNTDLEGDSDCRLAFLKRVAQLEMVDGYPVYYGGKEAPATTKRLAPVKPIDIEFRIGEKS